MALWGRHPAFLANQAIGGRADLSGKWNGLLRLVVALRVPPLAIGVFGRFFLMRYGLEAGRDFSSSLDTGKAYGRPSGTRHLGAAEKKNDDTDVPRDRRRP